VHRSLSTFVIAMGLCVAHGNAQVLTQAADKLKQVVQHANASSETR